MENIYEVETSGDSERDPSPYLNPSEVQQLRQEVASYKTKIASWEEKMQEASLVC